MPRWARSIVASDATLAHPRWRRAAWTCGGVGIPGFPTMPSSAVSWMRPGPTCDSQYTSPAKVLPRLRRKRLGGTLPMDQTTTPAGRFPNARTATHITQLLVRLQNGDRDVL